MSDVLRLCPRCGHAEHLHRENMPTRTTAVGDPLPCFAAIYYTPVLAADEVATDVISPFHYCGCTYLTESTKEQ